MDGAVKMPEAQVKINTANRAQVAKSSDTGIEFIKLLQVKGDQTKASEQGKTQQKTEDGTKTPSKEVEDVLSEDTGKKLENLSGKTEVEEEVDVEDMAQQAVVQQAAAVLAGMFVDNQEVNTEEMIPETENLSAVGEILTENVNVTEATPEVLETNTVELSSLQNLTETPVEVKAEAALPQTSIQETLKQSETAVQSEAAAQPETLQQKVNEAAQEAPKTAENKTVENKAEESKPASEEVVQSVSNEQKTEEKPETGKQPGQDLTGNSSRKEEGAITSGDESGQIQAAGAESFQVFGHQEQNSFLGQKSENVSMRTTPETIPEDLGKTLGAKFAEGARTLTVELEPASLGKLTIRLTYEGDRAAVSIIATNPKTLEMLNQKASEIAAILEEKTGQQTIIFTQKPETNQESYDREPDSKGNREEQEEKKQGKEEHHQMESFAQQLRLGLV